MESHIPLDRTGSAVAASITGQTLFVAGGLTLNPDVRSAWASE